MCLEFHIGTEVSCEVASIWCSPGYGSVSSSADACLGEQNFLSLLYCFLWFMHYKNKWALMPSFVLPWFIRLRTPRFVSLQVRGPCRRGWAFSLDIHKTRASGRAPCSLKALQEGTLPYTHGVAASLCLEDWRQHFLTSSYFLPRGPHHLQICNAASSPLDS